MKSCSVMEWNTKTCLQQWDWENLMMFNGKINEIPKQTHHHHQPTDWGMEGDGAIDNGSFYSSGGGGGGGGSGSSSKSSISASFDSSAKGGGIRISESKFETVEDSTNKDHHTKKKELGKVEDTGSSPTLGVVSGEPLIGLKLGKRTYFEDVCAGSSSTIKPSSFSVIPTSTSTITAAKRSRASYQTMQTPRCQVEGCDLDLTSAKDYHRRHRVCESHSKSPRVTIAGRERRFCQQCSRFHDLSEFDEKKRSCRRRLSDHNARRRKPPQEAIQFNSARLSSSFYDGRQQISFALNRVSHVHTTKPSTNPTWDRRSAKPEGMDSHHYPNSDLLNSIPSLRHDSEKFLSFKGATAEVLNQGLEASSSMLAPPNLDPTPDLRRALSLLSSNSWSSGDPESSSLDQLMHTSHNNISQPGIQPASQQGWPLASSEYWQADQQPAVSRVHPLTSPNNDNHHFQEFQLFKTPYEDGFYSNQMN